MLRTMKRSMTMTIAMMMVASIFAIMGLTTEQVSAATKKPAAVKSLTATASTQMVKASWKKASKVKVNKKNYVVNYQLKATVKSITGKTSSKTYTIKNATTSKTFYDHAGTKYTFKIRGYYTYKGKKVYGKWSAGKSKTIPKNGVSMSANRSSKGNVVAEARYTGNAKKQRYTTLVFSYNGAIKQCGINDYVSFPDSKAGTLTVYACYFTNGKTVKTTTTSKYIKASNVTSTTQPTTNPSNPTNNTGNTGNSGNTDNSEPSKGGDNVTGSKDPTNNTESTGNTGSTQPSTGGGTSGTPSGSIDKPNTTTEFNAIGGELPWYGGKTLYQRVNKDYNVFYISFDKDIKSNYTWKVYALSNDKFCKTLNINETPQIVNGNVNGNIAGHSYTLGGSNMIACQTNWSCTDVYFAAFDKTGKQVYGRKMGWASMPEHATMAPGNYHYGGPYYDRCVEIANKILDKSGFRSKYDDPDDKVYYLEKYTKYKFFRAYNYKDSMNVKKNLGFFENDMYMMTGSGEYLDIKAYDYSKVLAYLVGVDGGDCDHFQMIETFLIKQYDPNATISAHQSGNSNTPDHVAIKASIKGSGAFASTTVDYVIDLSTTYYYSTGSTGRQAEAMYNSSEWRNYFKMALGDEAAAYYGL